MVHLAVIVIEIRALAATGEPRDEANARRLAKLATKWIADEDRAAGLSHELTAALSANAFFAELNGGAVESAGLADIELILTAITAASRVQ